MITNDYLKTKLKAEHRSLNAKEITSDLDTEYYTARIAMLEEIMADLDLANRSVVILSVSEPRPAFE